MAVVGKRFKPFEDTYNLASSKFGAGVDMTVVNDAANELKAAATDFSDLVKNSIPSELTDIVKEGKDLAGEYIRDIKGVAGKVVDYAKMPEKLFNNLVTNVTGLSSPYTKPITDILSKCSKGSNYSFGGRPYDISMSCKGNTASLGGLGSGSSCNASNFSNLIDGMTGGAYNSGFKDMSSALRILTGLATQGYNFGMCGILNSLKGSDIFSKFNLGNTELSKVGGSLLGITGASGNLNGWLDVVAASAGAGALAVNPNAIGNLFSNFTLPIDTIENGLLGIGERVMGGLELLDSDWSVSDLDDMFSVSDLVGDLGITDAFSNVAEACLCARDFGEELLDMIPDTEDLYTYASCLDADVDFGTFA